MPNECRTSTKTMHPPGKDIQSRRKIVLEEEDVCNTNLATNLSDNGTAKTSSRLT